MSTFLHSGDLGDIIHSLAAVKALGGGTYYLCSRPWTKDMNPARYEAISALMRVQPYIKGVEMHKGQRVKYDFTDFRKHYRRGPSQNLATMHARAIAPGLALDTRNPWLSVPDFEQHGRPVIARSARYHCIEEGVERWDKIWPEVLEDFPGALFVGLPEEHQAFEKLFGKVEYRPTASLLEVARLIKGSSIFIGNQSSPMCVAEGLKHRSIQETHFRVNDVIFDFSNTTYLSSYKDWKKLRQKTRFAIMLQVYEGDYEQAMALAALINDIETKQRDDIELVIAGRFDACPVKLALLASRFSPRFPNVQVVISERRGTGWPKGPNELWAGAMMKISELRREGKLASDGVFTMEPDCLPLRRDWIAQLKGAWQAAKAAGKLATGFLAYPKGVSEDTRPTHLNGNLIISTAISRLEPRLVAGAPSGQPWDCHHGRLLVKIGQDTPTIYQNGRRETLTESEWHAVTKEGQRPAIWHGIKGLDGLRIAEKHLLAPETPAEQDGQLDLALA